MSFCLTGGGVYHIRGGEGWLLLSCSATANPNLGANFSKYECHFSEPVNIERGLRHAVFSCWGEGFSNHPLSAKTPNYASTYITFGISLTALIANPKHFCNVPEVWSFVCSALERGFYLAQGQHESSI
jgi:hypothetical protein